VLDEDEAVERGAEPIKFSLRPKEAVGLSDPPLATERRLARHLAQPISHLLQLRTELLVLLERHL
jgi:hypothetical protein